MQVLHEPYAHLYVGDYFTDTLDLSAHCALRLLLLETWVHGPVGPCASGKGRRTDKRGMAGYQRRQWRTGRSEIFGKRVTFEKEIWRAIDAGYVLFFGVFDVGLSCQDRRSRRPL